MGDKMDRERYNKQRERTDKISSLMGQYLLKGYRMLGTCCEKCGNVLLKFRDEPDYCVGCKEVDAIIPAAAIVPNASKKTPEPADQSWQVRTTANGYTITRHQPIQEPDTPSAFNSLSTAIMNLNEKIVSTSEALRNCLSVEESMKYCELLRSCAETLKVLHNIQQI